MPSKRPKLVTGEIYHIYNRGVEKRNIFQQIADYFRFIFCLYELNDKKLIRMRSRIEERKERKCRGSTPASKEPVVEILIFCLMPNHYHLVVRQLVDGGISMFMKKLGDSYVGYFNEKYNRKGMGSIFQGRYKIVHVGTEKQLTALICYIFTNPIELIEKNWKEAGVKDIKGAIKFLESYRWSSYLDYIGITNFPSVTKRGFITEFFGGPDKIEKAVEDWILYKTELKSGLEEVKDVALE
jgi:putative transposase